MGRLRHPSLDRTPGVVEGGEEGTGLRPRQGDHAAALSGPGRLYRAHRKGQVCCLCPQTGQQRRMAFQGFEAVRGTLKYRCPAAAYGYGCAGRESCYRAAGSQAGAFGRIDPSPSSAPYGSPKRGYRPPCAGADLQPTGQRLRIRAALSARAQPGEARVSLALTVMMALALAQAQCARWLMRSLSPIPDSDGSARLHPPGHRP